MQFKSAPESIVHGYKSWIVGRGACYIVARYETRCDSKEYIVELERSVVSGERG